MKKKIVVVIFIFYVLILEISAQDFMSTVLPKNAKAGKCYVRCTNFTEKWEWKETNCNIKKSKIVLSKEEKRQLMVKNCIELKAHQEKLKKLGYKIDVTGKYDEKTYYAHNKYLRDKVKYERKRRRIAKKLAKKKKSN